MYQAKYNYKRGQVVIMTVLCFVIISLIVISGVAIPTSNQIKAAQGSLHSKKSYTVADSINDDMFYRLNSGRTLPSSVSIAFGDGVNAEAQITDIPSGKQITTKGISSDASRFVRSMFSKGEGTSFNYGVQTGRGGIVMSNGSKIIGNVYANGDITGSGTITGDAVAANTSALHADQINDLPSSPTENITFRNANTASDFAQSFRVSTSSPINKVQIYIKKVGNPANASLRIVTDSNGFPSTNNVLSSQGTLSAALVTSSYGWVDIVLPSNPSLYPGITYWFVLDSSNYSSTNYYVMGANDQIYTDGKVALGVYGGTWNNTSPSTLDSYFKIYLGGLTSTINGITVGTAGIGDAWAHTIIGGSTAGTKYCVVGTGCDISRGDPMPIGFPISDANIEDWKEDALSGGTHTGDFTATTSSTLGPKVISGNLYLTNGASLTLTGTVWVKGNIRSSNNSIIKLDSNYGTNSGILISDGKINISNNSVFMGSGQLGSYILALTTSTCPIGGVCSGEPAISVANNVGAVILNAQRGTINIANNASLKEATAEKLNLSNNVTVTYESGLADIHFTSGPSGSWTVDSWKEIAE